VAKVVQTLEALDPEWEDTLMIVCSDHGHETVESMISIEEALVEAGLKEGLESNEVVVAPQGTAALIYLSEAAKPRCDALADFLETRSWVGGVYAGEALEQVGMRAEHSLALAIDMAKLERSNEFGVQGYSYMARDPKGSKDYTGLGQHGGMGANEQRPFMFARGKGLAANGEAPGGSSPVDIAPTILRHLGLPGGNLDGRPLQGD
jgi:predicted AlkP superfamily pyrophosphatase or phosphodiesterase